MRNKALYSLAIVLLLSACASVPENRSDENKKSAAIPQQEDEALRDLEENQLIVSVPPPAINLDPVYTFTSTEAQIYTAIYEGLVSYHPFTLEPLPAAASFWEISKDRRVYTFHLRDAARYWNGDSVKAEDFRRSWLKLLNPNKPGEYASLLDIIEGAREYRLGQMEDGGRVAITAKDDKTLEVRLKKPAPHFLKILCHHSFSPLHPKMAEIEDWTNLESVIGNGPFTIIRNNNEQMLLRKNQLYWDSQHVQLDSIKILYKEDAQWAAESIDNGTLHWAEGDVDLEALQNKQAMILNPVFSTTYFFYAGKQDEVYGQRKIRRALSLLVPWDKVRDSKYMYLPSSSLVPQIQDYPEIRGIEAANRERALELLAEAGYPEGEGLPTFRILLPEGAEAQRITDLMKGAWEESIGLNTETSVSSFGDYYDLLKEGDLHMGVLTWIGDFADPLSFLQMWTGDAPLNVGSYQNSDFDSLIERAAVEENLEERYRLMSEAEQLLLDDAALLPIKHSPAFNIIDLDRVQGWFPNPLDIHPFKYMEFTRYQIPDGVV